MNKFCFSVLLFLTLFTFLFFSFFQNLNFSSPYFIRFENNMLFNYISFSVTELSITFLFMVLIVSGIVGYYSEFYIGHYNNNNFLTLLVLFLVSIILLSLGESSVVSMMGWDGLGITSICLIMFYPNNFTLYNSILTIVFNRFGDVVLIFAISSFFFNFNNFFFFFSKTFNLILLCLTFCCFTKSAQFPLSSWLPAAISAPTPISAMVHSSTLVTAGIFLSHKFFYFFEFSNLIEGLFLFSTLTFLLGGFIANLEKDLNNVVAFSTMSQISIVIYFTFCGALSLALGHMFYHALFKTLLFCIAGAFFTFYFSSQDYFSLKSSSCFSLSSFFLFSSVFSISGLIYSSSFYSNDLLMELFISSVSSYIFIFLILGSFLTILYCSNILEVGCSRFLSCSFNLGASSFFLFLPLFFFLSIFISLPFKFFSIYDFTPSLGFPDLYLIFIFLVSAMLVVQIPHFFFGSVLSLEVSHMNFFTYSFYSSLFSVSSVFNSSFLLDHFLFKSSYFLSSYSPKHFFKSSLSFLFIFPLSLLLLY